MSLPRFLLGIHNFCQYLLIFPYFLVFFPLFFSTKKPCKSISRSTLGVRNLPHFGSQFILVVKNLSFVYVTVYFSGYKYEFFFVVFFPKSPLATAAPTAAGRDKKRSLNASSSNLYWSY